MLKNEIILTAAEFALFFEGADLEKRFIESPREIKKSKVLERTEPCQNVLVVSSREALKS